MGQKLVSSAALSLPAVVIGTSFFSSPHWVDSSFEKTAASCCYLSKESFKSVFLYISRNPIFNCCFLFPKLPIRFQFSTVVNTLSSAVLVGICDCSQSRRRSSSSFLLTSSKMCSRM